MRYWIGWVVVKVLYGIATGIRDGAGWVAYKIEEVAYRMDLWRLSGTNSHRRST